MFWGLERLSAIPTSLVLSLETPFIVPGARNWKSCSGSSNVCSKRGDTQLLEGGVACQRDSRSCVGCLVE